MSDEDPLGGRPRSRVAQMLGLLFAVVVAAFLVWYIASHTETRETGGSIFGAAVPSPAPRPG